ncbi:hypothetical protein H8D57_01610 [bacterium]|nr:hypothetical protein [bacterium]
MYSIENPNDMTSDDRFREVAWILAKGFSRLSRQYFSAESIDSGKLEKLDNSNGRSTSERLGNA